MKQINEVIFEIRRWLHDKKTNTSKVSDLITSNIIIRDIFWFGIWRWRCWIFWHRYLIMNWNHVRRMNFQWHFRSQKHPKQVVITKLSSEPFWLRSIHALKTIYDDSYECTSNSIITSSSVQIKSTIRWLYASWSINDVKQCYQY